MGLWPYRGRAARYKASTQSSHVVGNVGKITFCLKCVSYAERRWRGLAKSCTRTVPAHAAQARAQLLRGNHPRHNVFIAWPTAARVSKNSARSAANSKTAPSAAPCAYGRLIEEFGEQLPDYSLLAEPSTAPAAALSAAAAAADTGHVHARRRLHAKTPATDAERLRGDP